MRSAVLGDRSVVLALFAAANDARAGTYAPSVTRGEETLESWFDRKALERAWVVEVDGEVVGHVGTRRDEVVARRWGLEGTGWVEVARLAVHPSHQRRGYAHVLMEHVQGELAGERLWLTCHQFSSAHRLYLQLGWEETDLPIRWSDDPAPGVLLVLPSDRA